MYWTHITCRLQSFKFYFEVTGELGILDRKDVFRIPSSQFTWFQMHFAHITSRIFLQITSKSKLFLLFSVLLHEGLPSSPNFGSKTVLQWLKMDAISCSSQLTQFYVSIILEIKSAQDVRNIQKFCSQKRFFWCENRKLLSNLTWECSPRCASKLQKTPNRWKHEIMNITKILLSKSMFFCGWKTPVFNSCRFDLIFRV